MTEPDHIPGGEPHPSSIPPQPAAAKGEIPQTPEPEEAVAGVSLWADARRRLLKNRLAVAGVVLIVLVSLLSIFAGLFSPVNPERQHFWIGARPPGATHPDVRNFMKLQAGKPLLDTEVGDGLLGLTGAHTLTLDVLRGAASGETYRAVVNPDGTIRDLFRSEGATSIDAIGVAGPTFLFRQVGPDGHVRLDGGTEHEAHNVTLRKGAPLPAGFLVPPGNAAWTLLVNRLQVEPVTLTVQLDGMTVAAITEKGAGGAETTPSVVEVQGAEVRAIALDGSPLTLWHPFGTDKQGRDLFARVLYGGQISLLIALVATLVSLTIGLLYGATSGYAGGTVDQVMMRVVDILYGLPYIFLVIIMMVAFGKSIYVLFIALGAVQWLTMARIVRGQVLSLKEKEFVQAARTTGASAWNIIWRHLIPNVLGVVAVYTTLTIPAVVLQESFLAFIGLGVQKDGKNLASWGALVKDGMDNLGQAGNTNWWLLILPSLVMSLSLFAFNFLGDGLRDALDPQQKGRT